MGNIKLSEPQSRAFWSRAKSVGVVAGFGSGKTYAALAKAFDLLHQFPGVPVGYAAPTYGLIKDIWYPAVEQHCQEHGFKYDILKSDNVVSIAGLGKIVCRSMSNPDKIVGFEVGDFLLDELDILPVEMALNAWRKCKARCRYKFPKKKVRLPFGEHTEKMRKKNQMFAYTTPEGYKATYQLFKKNPLPGSELIQMSTYSNMGNLPDDYIDELMANYPPQLIEAYINGKFTNLTSGTVYSSFDRMLNNAPGILPFKYEAIHIGMDFNIQHMCSIVHVIRGGLPIACGEIIDVADTPNMIENIKEIYPTNKVFVYPDASSRNRTTSNISASDLRLLKNENFIVKEKRSNPLIKDRVISMNAMFCNAAGERRYLVNTSACPVYTENLEQQAYNEQGVPEKTDNVDHTNDAGGYFIETMFGVNKPNSQSSKLIM